MIPSHFSTIFKSRKERTFPREAGSGRALLSRRLETGRSGFLSCSATNGVSTPVMLTRVAYQAPQPRRPFQSRSLRA